MKNHSFLALFACVAISFCYSIPASAFDGSTWTVDWSTPKVFIENKGQFIAPGKPSESGKVKYAYEDGQTAIYFSATGLTYSFLKKEHEEKKEHENFRNEADWRREEVEEKKARLERDFVNLTWEGANANATVIAEDEVSDTYSYNLYEGNNVRNINSIRAYKKLIYKNLYPDIDVEFVFHPEQGIKYSLILHPGADISKVKMKYADGKPSIKNGDVHIHTKFGDIIDHAPVTFYSNDKNAVITSQFVKTGNTVSFLLGAYDNSKTIVVDPWTITPSFTNSNRIWDCEKDAAGNVYLYGGDTPCRLKKYNSAGTLQWTYNTPWDTANFWLGTLITDNAGNSYITSGSNGEISKVTPAGALAWHNNPNGAFGPLYEYWHLAFNCDQTQLIVGGMRGPNPFSINSFRGVAININLSNGAILSYTVVGFIAGFNIKEVRALCSSPNGNYYFMTLDSIGCVSSSLTLSWKALHGYNFSYGSPTYSIQGNLGMSAMRATGSFIYTQNGITVDKRDIATGAILATAPIPGGLNSSFFGSNAPGNSGLDIDSCGNVYVGSGNQVIKYNSNLVQLSSQTTTSVVYDVAVTKLGEVIVCGNGFASSFNMSACNPVQSICVLTSPLSVTSTSTNLLCNGQCTGTASVTASGGTGPYTYNWAPSGGTSAAATGLCANTYTCTITDNVGAQTTATFNITQPSVLNATATPTNISCNSVCNGSALGSGSGGTGPYTYSWNSAPVQNTANATSLCAGNYTVTVTDNNGCTTTQTATITQPAAITASATSTQATCGNNNGSATATASGGTGILTYNWAPTGGTNAIANGLPAGGYTCTITDANGCTQTASTTVTNSGAPSATLQAQTDVLCNGGNSGTATVNATGGSPGYTYAWTPTGGTNATGTGMPAGNYTCTITDAAGCTTTQTAVITEPGAIAASAVATPTGCSTNIGTATVTASGGTGTLTYNWAPSGGTAATATGLGAGVYTVTVTDANGCTTTANASVSSSGGPTTSVQSSSNVSCFGGTNGSGTINSTGNGPFTYAWSPTGGNAASATNLNAGTYSVTVTDANGCISIQTLTITEPSQLTSAPTSTSATCGNPNGTADAVASGGTGPYTYLWSNTQTTATLSNLAGGSYSVTVTDANGCTTTATVIVGNSGAPVVALQSSTNILCFGATTGTAAVTASGGTPPYTYAWSPTGGNAAGATNLGAATYTVTVTGSDGCAQTQTVTLTQPTAIQMTNASVPENCNDGDGSASVTASGGTPGYTYVWSNASTNDTVSNLTAGQYTCTTTDANGCTNTTTIVITSTGTAAAYAGASVTITQGQTTTLNGTGGVTYSWSPPDDLSCATCQNPIASPTVTTVYTLTVTDANGCTDMDTVIVYVDVACGEIYTPNAFSPNADHHNDVYYVRGNCIKLLDFKIYNRWGEEVFFTNDVTHGWDGIWRSDACEAAVFTYVLRATLVDGTEINRQGNISLVK